MYGQEPAEGGSVWSRGAALRFSINQASEEPKGLTYKALLKITEVCLFFGVSRPTIYDWIKHGKLKPYRIKRSVYFLWNDIQVLLQPS